MIKNWGMLGHEWAVELLKGHLKRGEPRHAYLFTGPSGVGRRTLALRFAQAINTEEPPAPGEFDPQSRTSQQIEKMQHPDLTLVERLEDDRDIKIEAVRNARQILSLSPYMANYRVALLLNFEQASNSAANAVLKTLEEPSRRVVMMVTADSAEGLLPTISSRCEVLRLRPVPRLAAADGLEEIWGIPKSQARFLAQVSGGRPGYALYLHQNPDVLEQRNTWLDDHRELLARGRVARFAYAEGLGKDKRRYEQMLQVWLSYWRDVLMRASASKALLSNPDREAEILGLSERVEISAAHGVVSAIEGVLGQMRTNVNTRLAAEVLMLNLPYI